VGSFHYTSSSFKTLSIKYFSVFSFKIHNMFGPEFLQQLSALKSATDNGMSRLPDLIVEGSAGNGLIRLKLDGNYKLKELHIAAELTMMEKSDLEDFLAIALQNAVDQVTALREKELMLSLANLVPNPEK
jgi:DNA-binding protein YbaB